MLRFFKCEKCENILTVVKEMNSKPFCACESNLKEIKIGSVDAAKEKHVPVVNVEGNKVSVQVGDVLHPMTEAHLIEWICLETDKGVYFRYLTAQDEPKADFILNNEKAIAVYEYCNLHGIWSAEVK